MNLHLTRPLAIFDIEATGLDITNDRIVEIAILRISPDGSRAEYLRKINPQRPIPPEISLIHGIYDKDVQDEPTFEDIASEIADFIADADLMGYNSNKFDVPMLAEEFIRAKSTFSISERRLVDVQNIFHKMEQRTLSAAYEFYCQKTLTSAHQAMADVQATWDVFQAQLKKYEQLEPNIDFLSKFTTMGDVEWLDFAGRIARNDKKETIYNFGKHKGKTIREVFYEEPGYYGWMINANFPLYTKQILKQEMKKVKALIQSENEKKQAGNQKKRQNPQNSDDLKEKLIALQNKFK